MKQRSKKATRSRRFKHRLSLWHEARFVHLFEVQSRALQRFVLSRAAPVRPFVFELYSFPVAPHLFHYIPSARYKTHKTHFFYSHYRRAHLLSSPASVVVISLTFHQHHQHRYFQKYVINYFQLHCDKNKLQM